MPETVLAIAAHPDDAELYCGGALAKLAADGATIHILVATDGHKGSFLDQSDDLAQVRAGEMARAATALGAKPPVLLGFPDMELDTLRPGVLREQLVREIRRLRPDIIFAHDPYAQFEPHPDHRAVAWAAFEAANYSRLPLVYPQHLAEGLEPHFTREQYYFGSNPQAANRIVDTTPYIARKIAALAEHRSQVVFLAEGIMRQAEMAGLDAQEVVGAAAGSPLDLLALGVRSQDASVGRRIGVAYAEAFRWLRYHELVEAALAARGAAQPVAP